MGGLYDLAVVSRSVSRLLVIVEALASAVFKEAVTDAADRLRGKGNVFQRLDDMPTSLQPPDTKISAPFWNQPSGSA